MKINKIIKEENYKDETGIKSSLLNNNEFTNLLPPKVFKWMVNPNIKIFNWKGSTYVITDGKMEIIINKNKPMSVIKPLGRVRGEIKKLYTENKTVNESLVLKANSVIPELLPRALFTTTDIKSKEKLKQTIEDLMNTLNKFYEEHGIDWKVKR